MLKVIKKPNFHSDCHGQITKQDGFKEKIYKFREFFSLRTSGAKYWCAYIKKKKHNVRDFFDLGFYKFGISFMISSIFNKNQKNITRYPFMQGKK